MKKLKVWSADYADAKFREYLYKIRGKKCIRCESEENLSVSHFWHRGEWSTRFDFDNCDIICYPHHYGNMKIGWEYHKQGEYRDFKIQQLGIERYGKMEKKFYQAKTTKYDAILALMMFLGKIKPPSLGESGRT